MWKMEAGVVKPCLKRISLSVLRMAQPSVPGMSLSGRVFVYLAYDPRSNH